MKINKKYSNLINFIYTIICVYCKNCEHIYLILIKDIHAFKTFT